MQKVKKTLFSAGLIMSLLFLLGISAYAVTIDGQTYDRTIKCANVIQSFEKYNGVAVNGPDGHTANLVKSPVTISTKGMFFNYYIGKDKSVKNNIHGTMNGGYAANFKATTWQAKNVKNLIGFSGTLTSPYRGLDRTWEGCPAVGSWSQGTVRTTGYTAWPIQKNSVRVTVNGLTSADAANTKLAIIGTGLPNPKSYGSSQKYSKSGTGASLQETNASYGSYYVSANIPNAGNYNISYKVEHVRGDKLKNKNDNINRYSSSGSSSFSTPSYYLESGGRLVVTITATQKNKITVDLRKGTGVTEPYQNKTFALYDMQDNYIKSATTNTSGYAYLNDVGKGTYKVKPRTSVPGHYFSPNPAIVFLTQTEATVQITMYRDTGALDIHYTTEDGMSRGNVKFAVTGPDGKLSYYYTNSSGNISLSNIPTGTYKVQQASTPSEYQGTSQIQTVTVKSSSITSVTFYNPIQYRLSVKLTAPSSAEQTRDFQITVQYINSGTKTARNVPVTARLDGYAIAGSLTTTDIPGNSTITRTYTIHHDKTGAPYLYVGINYWRDMLEDTYGDNVIQQPISITTSTDLSIEYVDTKSAYREGKEAIATFRVKNSGYNHMTPTEKLQVSFDFSYYDDGWKNIPAASIENVIVPSQGDNIVWVKFYLPAGTAYKQLCLSATVNPDHSVPEKYFTNNTVNYYCGVSKDYHSETPDTRYEAKMPDGISCDPSTNLSNPSAKTWAVWEWKNDWFEKAVYGLDLADSARPQLTPDINAISRSFTNGKWQMASGYGFTVTFPSTVRSVAGTRFPDAGQYTGAQTACLYFPEFNNSNVPGKYRHLERQANGSFALPPNSFAPNRARLHYTPLWFPNRDYIAEGYITDIWTPAGVVYGYRLSNPIQMVDSAYDDWYIGRK